MAFDGSKDLIHTKRKRFNKKPKLVSFFVHYIDPFRFDNKANSIGIFKIHPLWGR